MFNCNFVFGFQIISRWVPFWINRTVIVRR